MAEDLTRDEQSIVVPRADPEERVHRLRFAIAYLGLAVLAGIAVGAGILLSDEDRHRSETAWSQWQPSTSEPDAAREIADYVGGLYMSSSGGRLVAVIAKSPTIQDVPIRAVVIRSAVDGGVRETVETSSSLMYILCGTGDACALEGKPTQERYRLLRREALELALYTFRYVDGANSILVLMPASVDQKTNEKVATTLFFQKKDFGLELARPLQATLTLTNPLAQDVLAPTDALTVERLTNPRIFEYEVQQVQDGSIFMVLAPPGLTAR